ncbi:uncharacterized protein UBRO_05269 [Ustilago bromivora]|uniref:Uncharacterized protein n=1 Tax=Ustilago bromivora TaxID=307758 RepID=A0A1K0H9G1_9BASI|nr:uncharacterized protein UBRO_05269 [Ustilago bromivora]
MGGLRPSKPIQPYISQAVGLSRKETGHPSRDATVKDLCQGVYRQSSMLSLLNSNRLVHSTTPITTSQSSGQRAADRRLSTNPGLRLVFVIMIGLASLVYTTRNSIEAQIETNSNIITGDLCSSGQPPLSPIQASSLQPSGSCMRFEPYPS